jgi:hypothetical protein
MASPCAISGNLNSLLAGNAVGAQVVFILDNLHGSIPYVAGVSTMVSIQAVFTADGSGNISGSLWGNDVISPAGTQYQIIIGTQTNVYNVAGSAWNLNTATPATAPPANTLVIPDAGSPLAVTITGVPGVGGNFTLPHTLGYVPRNAVIQLTSLGIIVFQSTYYDMSNLYLTASGGGITGRVLIW